MENSLYFKINRDMVNCRRTHNQISNSIENVRENQYSKIPCFICPEGIIITGPLLPNHKRIVRDIHSLMDYDDRLKAQLNKYHFEDFIGVLKN
jgi:hypothetical protein